LGKKRVNVFSFDIILDGDLKPWLLEVNHTPSFTADTPLDLQIKKHLIMDTLVLANIKNKTKKKYLLVIQEKVIFNEEDRTSAARNSKRNRKRRNFSKVNKNN
jgi:hypothetical protein